MYCYCRQFFHPAVAENMYWAIDIHAVYCCSVGYRYHTAMKFPGKRCRKIAEQPYINNITINSEVPSAGYNLAEITLRQQYRPITSLTYQKQPITTKNTTNAHHRKAPFFYPFNIIALLFFLSPSLSYLRSGVTHISGSYPSSPLRCIPYFFLASSFIRAKRVSNCYIQEKKK